VDSFKATDAVCVAESQKCFARTDIWQNLAYIKSNFGVLPSSITKLEKQGLTLHEAMEIFAGAHNHIDSATGEKADVIKQKFDDMKKKNTGLEEIIKICHILSGNHIDCDVPPNLIPFYKYAPLTSCDVERSFSVYKSVLADNRMSFTPSNLEKYLICNYNMRNDV
jgi:hypothetical protein